MTLKQKIIKKIKKELFDLGVTAIIFISCVAGFMCVVFLLMFLVYLQLHPGFIIIISIIACCPVYYLYYRVQKYFEKFEQKEKSAKDKEIDNLFDWNPKG